MRNEHETKHNGQERKEKINQAEKVRLTFNPVRQVNSSTGEQVGQVSRAARQTEHNIAQD